MDAADLDRLYAQYVNYVSALNSDIRRNPPHIPEAVIISKVQFTESWDHLPAARQRWWRGRFDTGFEAVSLSETQSLRAALGHRIVTVEQPAAA